MSVGEMSAQKGEPIYRLHQGERNTRLRGGSEPLVEPIGIEPTTS